MITHEWLNKVKLLKYDWNTGLALHVDDKEKFNDYCVFLWETVDDKELLKNNFVYTLVDLTIGDGIFQGYYILDNINNSDVTGIVGYFISTIYAEIPNGFMSSIEEYGKAETIDEWLDKVYLIPPPEKNSKGVNYLWDDADAFNQHEELYEFIWDTVHNKDLYPNYTIYTIIGTDDGDRLVNGYHYVNRIGHFISVKEIDLPKEGIEY